MFRGVVTREYLWGPVLPGWYVGTGTVRRDAPRGGEGPARYVLRVPEQLRNPDTLKVPEWENIRGITGT